MYCSYLLLAQAPVGGCPIGRSSLIAAHSLVIGGTKIPDSN
jgi:carbonic anhydrase/acetyltransferase-like protein (isoleucine patch superfamily)